MPQLPSAGPELRPRRDGGGELLGQRALARPRRVPGRAASGRVTGDPACLLSKPLIGTLSIRSARIDITAGPAEARFRKPPQPRLIEQRHREARRCGNLMLEHDDRAARVLR